jgi:hypothetical protein
MVRKNFNVLGPDELIIKKKETDDPKIFFISKGEVDIYLDIGSKNYSMID